MDPRAVGALIPIVAIAGFFSLMIARTMSKAYLARLEAQRQAGAGGGSGHDELVAAVDELRQEVAELAERVDFTERLLGQQRGSERLGPPRA